MEPDKEASENIKKSWNKLSNVYEDVFENYTIPSSCILYSATKASKASMICEVGVG